MLFTRVTKEAEAIEEETKFQRDNTDFAKGYLAGMLDTDGSVSGGSIRIAQSKSVNKEKYDRIISCCKVICRWIKC